MKLFDALTHRTIDDLPQQPTDDDLIAWAEQLSQPRRRRPLVAEPAA